MISNSYDIVVVGGGIVGSAFAKSMAESGVRVLVLEKEIQYRARVAGECLEPWGVAEARKLGIYIQQALCDAATRAGADVRHGITVRAIRRSKVATVEAFIG